MLIATHSKCVFAAGVQPIAQYLFVTKRQTMQPQRFFGDDATGSALVARYGTEATPLLADDALEVVYQAACAVDVCPAEATWPALRAAGLAPAAFPPSGPFTRGEAYALAARIARLAPIAAHRTGH